MSNEINQANKKGESALIIAAPKGDIEEVRSLLRAGADPFARDMYGMTARTRAKNRGHDEIVALLLDAEEKIGREKQRKGETGKEAVDEVVVRPRTVSNDIASYRYSIYSHPTLGYEAVKNGFSWPAFFFTWIWAFIKKLWGHGIVLMVVLTILIVAESVFELMENIGGVLIICVLAIGAFLFVGFNGNTWLTRSMARRGFEFVAGSMAKTPDAAIAEMLNQKQSNSKDSAGATQPDVAITEEPTMEISPMEQDASSDNRIYEQIADELDSGEMDRAVWTKALAMSEGDIEKQKALYVRLRASVLGK